MDWKFKIESKKVLDSDTDYQTVAFEEKTETLEGAKGVAKELTSLCEDYYFDGVITTQIIDLTTNKIVFFSLDGVEEEVTE